MTFQEVRWEVGPLTFVLDGYRPCPAPGPHGQHVWTEWGEGACAIASWLCTGDLAEPIPKATSTSTKAPTPATTAVVRPYGDGEHGRMLTRHRNADHECLVPQRAREGDVWECQAQTPEQARAGERGCGYQWLAGADHRGGLEWRPTSGHTAESLAATRPGRPLHVRTPWWAAFAPYRQKVTR